MSPLDNDRFDTHWAAPVAGRDDLERLIREHVELLGDKPIKWVDDDVIENVHDGDGVTTALSLIWALRQPEPMEFVADMQSRLFRGGSISVAQVRGLWNVIRATEQREQEAKVHAYVNYGKPPRFGGIASLMASLAERMERPKIALAREDDESVWLSIAGERARFPGSINVTNARGFGGNWHGRIVEGVPDAQLAREDAVMAALDTLEADPSVGNAVASHARATGSCMVCGRVLTNAESIARGIGPICAGKVGM